MTRDGLVFVSLLCVAACSSNATTDAGVDASRSDGGSGDAGSSDAGSTSDGGVDPDLGAGAIGIATCAPSAGACPTGTTVVDVTTASDLMDAARGEGSHASDAPGTCYFVHDGTYAADTNVLLLVGSGGTATTPRRFVGESRDGVRIIGRATIDASFVEIDNMTFDLTGYTGNTSAEFNTITVIDASSVTLAHLTITGDCATGYRGGAVEVETSTDVTIACDEIERFGQCTGDGHLDHGVYLASGSRIAVRSCDIHDNSSRGIQLNTEGGSFGTLSDVTIEQNRIHHNGHRAYEDGIVMNATGTGSISRVDVRNNVIDDNEYSGIRFSGDQFSVITVRHNTFYRNGARAPSGSPSEVNLDATGDGASTSVYANVIEVQAAELNDCYESAPRGFSLHDNVVHPAASTGACIDGNVVLDPMLADPAGGDFHATAAGASGYGAYATGP